MDQRGDVWASRSRDDDSLLLGTPRLIRYLTIQGQEWLPSKDRARKLEPELIDLEVFLGHHGITREQLVDLGIIVGTDFNDGIRGIGPKTALKLVREHGRLEEMPEKVTAQLPETYPEIRRLFLEPEVTDDYTLAPGELDGEGLVSFLYGEKGFSRERVESVIERIEQSKRQRRLSDWLGGET
jgi:flap endonuclease-1